MPSPTICWEQNRIKIIDQTLLPNELKYIYCRDLKTLWKAIKTLQVRGAPALGVAAAFGILLGTKDFEDEDKKEFIQHLNQVCDYIGSSRPTAVNLFNAINRIKKVVTDNSGTDISSLKNLIRKEAFAIYEEDRQTCRAMGKYGAQFIKNNSTILTVCNAGALATVDYGTALGVMYSAKALGKNFKVYACETRPLLQGARLTAWELIRGKIDTTLICDNMAASLMAKGKIAAVFAGADRIASNGDTANKIGTYSLAVLANFHKIPFYIVAPYSTFDLKIKSGCEIPIEQRAREEVTHFRGVQTAPQNVKVYNPAFDVTPRKLIKAIITEYGVISPVNKANILKKLTRHV